MKRFPRILAAVQILSAAAVIGAVKVWAPVCGKMLELADGREVHMKCFYTGQAAVAVGVILLAAAVMTLLSKTEYKKMMVVSAIGAVILFLLFTNLIGICTADNMACHATAIWCKSAAVVTFAASVIGILSGKDGQVPT